MLYLFRAKFRQPIYRLAEAMGRNGVVNVTRDLGLRELYQGQTSMVTGEVDEDVERFRIDIALLDENGL